MIARDEGRMSGRRKVGDGDVEIMVIRSSDGKKANVRRSFVSISEALFSHNVTAHESLIAFLIFILLFAHTID